MGPPFLRVASRPQAVQFDITVIAVLARLQTRDKLIDLENRRAQRTPARCFRGSGGGATSLGKELASTLDPTRAACAHHRVLHDLPVPSGTAADLDMDLTSRREAVYSSGSRVLTCSCSAVDEWQRA